MARWLPHWYRWLPGRWAMWLVSGLFVGWGLLLTIDQRHVPVLGIYTLRHTNPGLLGAFMVAAGVCTIAAMRFDGLRFWLRVTLLLPQQYLAVLGLYGVGRLLIARHDWSLLGAELLVLIVGVCYVLAVLRIEHRWAKRP